MLRDWKLYSNRSWPNKDNIDLTPTILQVGGPISGSQKKASLVSAWSSTNGNTVGDRSYPFRIATPKQVALATPLPRIFLLTSISSSTMCTLPSDPFVESFYSLKKTFLRLQSTDGTSFNIARPSSAPPILMTPSSTIRAANIAMPVTSKIHFDLPAPKRTLIAHRNQIGS